MAEIFRAAILAESLPKPFTERLHLFHEGGADRTPAQMLLHLGPKFRGNCVFQVSRGYPFEFLAIHLQDPFNTVNLTFLSNVTGLGLDVLSNR